MLYYTSMYILFNTYFSVNFLPKIISFISYQISSSFSLDKAPSLLAFSCERYPLMACLYVCLLHIEHSHTDQFLRPYHSRGRPNTLYTKTNNQTEAVPLKFIYVFLHIILVPTLIARFNQKI